jgi:RNA polymerase sigma-70 factor (ECF subfamily)
MGPAAICFILLVVPAPAENRAFDRVAADAADVARFQGGDESAFEPLVTRSEAEIFRLARRMLGDSEDALDAAQETFLRAFRGLRSFRGEAAFRSWLIGIAINVCRNKRGSAAARASRLNVPLVDEDPETGAEIQRDLADPRPNPEAAAHGAEIQRALARALVALAAEHREILLLREMEGLEYDEIVRVLGCPLGTVKSRLCRARAALREALEGLLP